MATCITKKKAGCIGDLDKLIQIESRAILAPKNRYDTDVDADVIFTNRIHVYANITTKMGVSIFDEVSDQYVMTHVFKTLYLGINVTKNDWIIYNNSRYEIQTVENINEDSLFILMRAILRGSDTKEASKA
jgi:lipocalin